MTIFLWIEPNPNQILKLNEMKFQHFIISISNFQISQTEVDQI